MFQYIITEKYIYIMEWSLYRKQLYSKCQDSSDVPVFGLGPPEARTAKPESLAGFFGPCFRALVYVDIDQGIH